MFPTFYNERHFFSLLINLKQIRNSFNMYYIIILHTMIMMMMMNNNTLSHYKCRSNRNKTFQSKQRNKQTIECARVCVASLSLFIWIVICKWPLKFIHHTHTQKARVFNASEKAQVFLYFLDEVSNSSFLSLYVTSNNVISTDFRSRMIWEFVWFN